MRLLILALAMLLTSSPARGETTSWTGSGFKQNIMKDGKLLMVYTGEFALGESISGPDILLTCSEQYGLTAAILTRPAGIEEIFESRLRDPLLRTGRMQIGDGEKRKGDWIMERKSRALYPRAKWQTTRVYNAIITGDVIKYDISRSGKYEITPPPMDETFKRFVRNCPAL